MKDYNEFYKNTQYMSPHKNVIDFLSLNVPLENAVDLGCGSGRDTIHLIKNGWSVISIDKNDTSKLITEKLSEKDLLKFSFSRQDFQNIKLPKSELIVANFSIPFCHKDYFDEFWIKISDSILPNRIFRG